MNNLFVYQLILILDSVPFLKINSFLLIYITTFIQRFIFKCIE